MKDEGGGGDHIRFDVSLGGRGFKDIETGAIKNVASPKG